jgi:hypothetical protein
MTEVRTHVWAVRINRRERTRGRSEEHDLSARQAPCEELLFAELLGMREHKPTARYVRVEVIGGITLWG